MWFAAILLYGLRLLPWIESRSHEAPDNAAHFWRFVALGWALGPGIPVGVLFGALFVSAGNLDWSANGGAFLGLLLGPVIASSTGLVVAGVVNCGSWCWTGRSVFADAPK